MCYDLHVHSTYSDGTLAPSEVLDRAIAKGLKGIALTDHDNVDGIAEALAEAKKRNFQLIPGVEITTDFGDYEAHILGYNFDWQHPRLLQKLEQIVASRVRRAQSMIEKLNHHHVPVTWEQVLKFSNGRFVGRPHIFKAMEAIGYVDREHRNSVFDYYLGQSGVAYIPHQEIETKEAIELILDAGGIPVLAHPGRVGADHLIEQFAGWGLRGIEVYYPSHTQELIDQLLIVAEKLQLYVTGGSDFHGRLGQAELGDAQVSELPWVLSGK